MPWRGGPTGWKIACFPPEVMKGKRPHSLPIPPRVALLFERAVTENGKSSAFAFPATRGASAKNAPVSRWSVVTAIDRLRGRSADPKAGEEFDGPDLLEGLPYFSPHDIRRTFATVCEDLTVRGDAISAVLDHVGIDMGHAAPMKVADITRVVYDYSQRLDLKRIAVEVWTDALFEAVESEWRSHRLSPRPGRPILHPTEQATDSKGRRRFSNIEPWYIAMEREAAEAERAYLATILEPWEMDDSPEHQAWLRMRYEEEMEEMQRANSESVRHIPFKLLMPNISGG